MSNDTHESPPNDIADRGNGRKRVGALWLLRDRVLYLAVFGVFFLDQATKWLIGSWLPLGQSWPQEGFLRITHGTNSGTAFGLFPDQTTLLVVVSLAAIGFLFFFYQTHAFSNLQLRAAIGLQLGGAFGNLIDRVRFGEVVDFIDVGAWPIFNLADSSIVVGIAILMASLLFSKESKPSEIAKEEEAPLSNGQPTMSTPGKDE